MSNDKLKPGYVWIHTPYITRNGKRIYHPKGKMYKFQVPADKKRGKPKEK